jgi:TRAP-type C4-dicarboxylate transport system substrate-binding protein
MSISRIRHAWSAAALAVAALVAAGPAAVANTLKIATVSPDGSAWMRVLREAGGEVEAATEGRVKLRYYPGGVMGDDASVMRRVRAGQLHGGVMLTSAFANIYHDLQAYNLPMVFRDLGEVDAVREKLDAVITDGFREHGFVSFGIAEVGMAYPMSTKYARTVEQARKLKVWIPQGDVGSARILEAFDIQPIPLPISEVLAGLQTGLVDAVTSPPVAALPLLWHTRLKYVLDLPLVYVYGTFAVSERSLRGISQADVDVLQRIMEEGVARVDRLNRADHDAARRTLKEQGLEFIALSAEEEADWRAYAAAAARNWVANGVVSADVYRQVTERLAEVRGGGEP